MKYALVSSVVLLLLGVHPAKAQQTVTQNSDALKDEGMMPGLSR
jgi:hypothetical protein